jgi:hypothetical protein
MWPSLHQAALITGTLHSPFGTESPSTQIPPPLKFFSSDAATTSGLPTAATIPGAVQSSGS